MRAKPQVRNESIMSTKEDNVTPPKSQNEDGTSNKTPGTSGSTNTDRPLEPIE